eukprot:4827551-Amphidinium_carterae.1
MNPADAGSRVWEPTKHAKKTRRPCSQSLPPGAGKYQPQDSVFLPEMQSRPQRVAQIGSRSSIGCLDGIGTGRVDGGVFSSSASRGVAQRKRTEAARGHDLF